MMTFNHFTVDLAVICMRCEQTCKLYLHKDPGATRYVSIEPAIHDCLSFTLTHTLSLPI